MQKNIEITSYERHPLLAIDLKQTADQMLDSWCQISNIAFVKFLMLVVLHEFCLGLPPPRKLLRCDVVEKHSKGKGITFC